MTSQAHWEEVYRSKEPQQTSWYEPHLETSFDWITGSLPDHNASIIDIGGGESTLVDDLLAVGYSDVTVLDISLTAIEKCEKRLGVAKDQVRWLVADVTKTELPPSTYDLWHDRAVFHFLTEPEQRAAYKARLVSSLKPEGHVVIATFGPRGPERCSGLKTVRYDAESMLREMGAGFHLVRNAVIDHQTPFGTTQEFLYCEFSLTS